MTLRELMTDGRFEYEKRTLMKKPQFFYRDSIVDQDNEVFEGKYKWICKIGDQHLFLPDMDRMYPLIYLQPMSIPRLMDWELTRVQDGVTMGTIINRNARPTGSRVVTGLLPGLVKQEFPMGETPKSGGTFISRFIAAKGDFPATNFQTMGWIHSQEKAWWARMVGFMLEHLKTSP